FDCAACIQGGDGLPAASRRRSSAALPKDVLRPLEGSGGIGALQRRGDGLVSLRVKVVEYLSRKSRTTLLIMGVVVVGYLAMMDYVTGPVALLVFYLIPICFVAWFAGRSPGIVTAFAAAGAWGIVKILSPDSIDSYPKLLWNV